MTVGQCLYTKFKNKTKHLKTKLTKGHNSSHTSKSSHNSISETLVEVADNAALCIQFQYAGLLKYGENGPICTFSSALAVYKIAQKSNTVSLF